LLHLTSLGSFFKKCVFSALSNSCLSRMNFMFSSTKLSQILGSVESG
jgi:hypothetical protein